MINFHGFAQKNKIYSEKPTIETMNIIIREELASQQDNEYIRTCRSFVGS